MTARLLGFFPPGSPEWHDARKGRIGGSEIAAVLGLSPWESKFSLWHRKAGLIDPKPDNAGMEWGRRAEDMVAVKFADEHPEFVVTEGGTWQSRRSEWQVANPDRLLSADVAGRADSILEVKTAYSADGWGESGTDEIPVGYRTQMLWYMDVLEVDQAHVAVLISGSDYREYVIRFDADEAQLLRHAALEFLLSIDMDEPPNVDAHSATYQAIRDLHPEITDDSIELSDELAEAYCIAHDDLTAAKAAEALTKAQVAEAMGTARKATWKGHAIASRQVRGDSTPFVVAARTLPEFRPFPEGDA